MLTMLLNYEVSTLIHGSSEEQETLVKDNPDNPAVKFHLLLKSQSTVTIDDIATAVDCPNIELLYSYISEGDLSDAEMEKIANILGVPMSVIWVWK